jgi:hypothetical protein
MKKLVVVIIALLNVIGLYSQTYYYERVAKIEPGGRRVADSGDGHFITFTDFGCYDSDDHGMTAQTGFRDYKKSRNGVDQFYGKSYFGNAYYSFSSDRSRLNIDVERDGTIYVYERRTAPSQETSSMRKYSPIVVSPGVYIPFVPIWTPPVMSSSSYSSSSSTSSVSGGRICTACNGNGQCTSCHGVGYHWMQTGYYTGDSSYSKVDCGACHSTGRCMICYGKGKIR